MDVTEGVNSRAVLKLRAKEIYEANAKSLEDHPEITDLIHFNPYIVDDALKKLLKQLPADSKAHHILALTGWRVCKTPDFY